jgi:hypothetical protein
MLGYIESSQGFVPLEYSCRYSAVAPSCVGVDAPSDCEWLVTRSWEEEAPIQLSNQSDFGSTLAWYH